LKTNLTFILYQFYHCIESFDNEEIFASWHVWRGRPPTFPIACLEWCAYLERCECLEWRTRNRRNPKPGMAHACSQLLLWWAFPRWVCRRNFNSVTSKPRARTKTKSVEAWITTTSIISPREQSYWPFSICLKGCRCLFEPQIMKAFGDLLWLNLG
jgi:hypothetical protein